MAVIPRTRCRIAGKDAMKRTGPKVIELDTSKLEEILGRVEANRATAEDHETIRTLSHSYVHLLALLKDKNTKIGRLRKLLFGASTEKTKAVLGDKANEATSSSSGDDDGSGASEESAPGEDSRPPPIPGKGSGEKKESTRRGLFTSGIVSTREGHQIALFFSGRKHAGENLSEVLAERAKTLGPPIQMCDALSRNLPADLETILANCLAHGRRQFVDVVDRFPDQCGYVLESLKVVYRNDTIVRKKKLSSEARLQFHQAESGPVMEQLQTWLTRQFEEHLVEPNSALGQAISYMLRHWAKLTLFLRKAGAPLDNNICERALKKV